MLAQHDAHNSEGHEPSMVVHEVLPRSSQLERMDNKGKGRGQTHVLAANVDQIFIIAAPLPPLNTTLVDRYLLSAQSMGLPITIVFNKLDLGSGGDVDPKNVGYEAVLAEYKRLG